MGRLRAYRIEPWGVGKRHHARGLELKSPGIECIIGGGLGSFSVRASRRIVI